MGTQASTNRGPPRRSPTKSIRDRKRVATGVILLSSTQCHTHEDVQRISILDLRPF